MLFLAKTGFENLLLSTADPEEAEKWLTEKLDGRLFKEHAVPVRQSHGYTLIYLQNAAGYSMIAVPHSCGAVLSAIINDAAFPAVKKALSLPRTIFMNLGRSYNNIEPLVVKLMRELKAQKISLSTAYEINEQTGALITFLQDTKDDNYEIAYNEGLFIPGNYEEILNYLRIHAPRYLAKVYPPDAWHMVDVRMYDKHEKYHAQYRRLLHAVEALDLGYVVNESWERETEPFTQPVGTYRIRLLTFMEPLELKIWLMALEYDLNGVRIVDLDAYYHQKKISWRDVMNDKGYRKLVLGSGLQLNKSIFFAETSNKAALLEYSLQQLQSKLAPAEVAALRSWENQITVE